MIDFDKGVQLDRLTEVDLETTYEWRNMWEVWRWCRQNDLLHEQAHRQWYEWQASDPSVSMYAIRTDIDFQLVGVCGLTSIDRQNRRAEFSLYIGPEFQRKGYAKAALSTLFSHGFINLGLNCIWGETLEDNPAGDLFERIGMTKEGVRRQFYWKDGKFVDARIYSVLASEWTDG